jgi:hypothetical protein
LQQIRIDEHTQLSAVTKGRHATIGLGNLLSRHNHLAVTSQAFNKDQT